MPFNTVGDLFPLFLPPRPKLLNQGAVLLLFLFVYSTSIITAAPPSTVTISAPQDFCVPSADGGQIEEEGIFCHFPRVKFPSEDLNQFFGHVFNKLGKMSFRGTNMCITRTNESAVFNGSAPIAELLFDGETGKNDTFCFVTLTACFANFSKYKCVRLPLESPVPICVQGLRPCGAG